MNVGNTLAVYCFLWCFSYGKLVNLLTIPWALFSLAFQVRQRGQAGDHHGRHAGLGVGGARCQGQSAVNHHWSAQVCVPGSRPPSLGGGHTGHGLHAADAAAAYVRL